jgi:hypothetical protein
MGVALFNVMDLRGREKKDNKSNRKVKKRKRNLIEGQLLLLMIYGPRGFEAN